MKQSILILMALLLGFSTANAFDQSYVIPIEEFENLQITEKGITFNNFSLSEDRAFLAQNIAKVEISFSIRNRNTDAIPITVMFAGIGDGRILWAINTEPMMAIVSPTSTETLEDSSYIPFGTVKKTEKIWMRVVGDF